MKCRFNIKNHGQLWLSDRDKDLFYFLFAFKVASGKQIANEIFKTTTYKNCMRRLKKLERAKLIKSDLIKTEKGYHHYYHLTMKCFKLFISNNTDGSIRKELKSNCPEHDLTLVDIYSRIKNYKSVKEYLGENIIQSGLKVPSSVDIDSIRYLNSDAIVSLKVDQKSYPVSIEYERAAKSGKRYEQIFKAFEAQKQLAAVFYICETEKLKEQLINISKKGLSQKKSKIYFITLPQVQLNPDVLTLTNCLNVTFSLKK